jgi:hypothetical protein
MTARLFRQSEPPETIRSVSVLVGLVKEFKGPVFLRGQADARWGLLPTITRLRDQWHAGRQVPVVNLILQEEYLLHRFRRHTYEQRGRILNKWEALFLARHHGLPVRLLDWTSNPLVALYWACLFGKDPGGDGAIWYFKRRTQPKDVDVFEPADPEDIRGVRIIYPFYPTLRMTAQSGLFTIHAHPWKDLTEMPASEYDPKDLDIETGDRWIIPKEDKGELLRELERLGINSRTLFPELDGLARGLLHTEAFRLRDEYPESD